MSSKLDKLKQQKQASGLSWAPREAVKIEPLSAAPAEPAATYEPPKPKKQPKKPAGGKTPKAKTDEIVLVPLFAKIAKEDKRWLDHYRIDAEKELSDVITEAISLLKAKHSDR